MSTLNHLNEQGEANIVDIGAKEVTRREAVAKCCITMRPETLQQVQTNAIAKGDVWAVARIAGIQSAKATTNLIPLCHPIRIDKIAIDFDITSPTTILVIATVNATERTGVEMEALVAASTACLTIYDMCKAIDREMVIGPTYVAHKSGGKTGDFTFEPTS
ncbi:MAG: cyclic pyranopterin monophosphate synthase MoaC [Pirellulaceae bacterium]